MEFKRNILPYTLIPLFVLFVATSYFRFMVLHDYRVAYEGKCDAQIHSCFSACVDESCTEEYTYSKIQKKATLIFAECGSDITNCKEALFCSKDSDDDDCSVTYCDELLGDKGCRTSSLQSSQDDNFDYYDKYIENL